jgi:hypothetical protein
MQRPPRKLGRAVAPITDEATSEVLGWTYEWDNGEASEIAAEDLHPRLDPERDAAEAPEA